jgi:hypothetical protein
VPTNLDLVDGEVRELIRRRGSDPFTDPGPVRVRVRDDVVVILTQGADGRRDNDPVIVAEWRHEVSAHVRSS